jgi:hypothetical protein
MNDLEAMTRLINALRPWLADLVVIGGWAHHLLRYHPDARAPAYEPLRTRDADIAFSSSAALEGNILEALQSADFQEELRGEHTPPVTRYALSDADQGFYVEFLAPRTGDGLRRNGQPDATIAKAGVTAQKLRHVDLLLIDPWYLLLDKAIGIPISEPANVLVANPVSFIGQRLLIHQHRDPMKRAQDVLYIHDTLELFGHRLDALRAGWRDRVRPRLAAKTATDIDRGRDAQFGAVTDAIREAARIPQDRTLSSERMRATCEYGLEGIFGSD